MKKCKDCDAEKEITEFFRDKGMPDGRASICKICKTKKTMAWRAENKEHYNSYMRQTHKKHYLRNRLYRYDLTPEQYQILLTEQNNKCAICGNPPKSEKPLVIDHDHNTGKVRGLLCYGCNRLMVLLDNEELLAKAQTYKNKVRA